MVDIRSISRWAFLRSVMSSVCEMKKRGRPSSSRTRASASSPQTTLPSGRRKRFSSRPSSAVPSSIGLEQRRCSSPRSSTWVMSRNVTRSSESSSRPSSLQSASLTRRKRPSIDTSDMPIGAAANASSKLVRARDSSASRRLRSVTSRRLDSSPMIAPSASRTRRTCASIQMKPPRRTPVAAGHARLLALAEQGLAGGADRGDVLGVDEVVDRRARPACRTPTRAPAPRTGRPRCSGRRSAW